MSARTVVIACLTLLVFINGCGGSTGPAAKSTTAPITATSIASILDQERAWYPAPGALALVRVGSQQWTAHSGSADLAGTPINDETRFRIASITKPIVATLVLDAVSRGELSIDGRVDDVLPNVLQASQPVTVRMLLDHTSGIFDETNDATDIPGDINKLADSALKAEAASLLARVANGERVIAPDRILVALAETHDRYFGPGQGYHYSNINYQIAAMILVRITGTTLDALLRSRIIEPLGLRHTTIAPPDISSPELRGYDLTNDKPADATDNLLAFGNGGNGGIISTTGDLLTIMQAIISGKFLPRGLLAQMKAGTSQSSGTYGLGLAGYRLSCGSFFGHGGSVNGTMSLAIVSPDGSRGAVVAVNLRSDADPKLTALADQLLCGRR